MVGAIAADLAPDQRLYLGGRLGLRELEVIAGHVDDRGPQLCVAGGRLPGRIGLCRLLERELVQRHAGRRGQRGGARSEAEPCDHTAGAHGDKRRRLLPPCLPDGVVTVPLPAFPLPLPGASPYPPEAGRLARMARTWGLPGLSAFANSTPASPAIRDGVPSIHCWNTSLTRAACPDALLTGDAQTAG